MDYRVKNTQVVHPGNEPSDGEMEDLENDVQAENAKRVKTQLSHRSIL